MKRRTATARDLLPIEQLVRAHARRHIHVLDLPYRLSALCESGAAGRLHVWEDDRENLIGFAAWQPAFRMLDYGYRPGRDAGPVARAVMDWNDAEFGRRAAESEPEKCWIKSLPVNAEWRHEIEAHGFRPCPWSIAHLELNLHEARPMPTLTAGFAIRQVRQDEDDAWAMAHRAVFPRVGMTARWRARIAKAASYDNALDLVAVAPDGTIAGLCLGWLGPIEATRVCEVEPLGTVPSFRRLGIAGALLQALAERAALRGAATVFSEPWDDNHAALDTYRAAGFRVMSRIPVFEKSYTSASAL